MLDPNPNPPPHDRPFLFNQRNSVESDTSYGTWQPMNYASRPQRTSQNYDTFRARDSMRPQINGEDDSGVCSPPLWKTTSRAATNNYRSLSPASKTQAIARGQRELMEMVKNMPESCYELSLKDLVEHHHRQPTVENEEEDQDQEDGGDVSTENLMRRGSANSNKKGDHGKNFKKKKMVRRSGSVNNGGFLLKMVLPFSLGSNKKSKIQDNKSNAKNMAAGANSNRDASAKVSPKPQGVDAPGKGGVDSNSHEWWKMKRLSNSASGGRSESGVYSSVSSGSMKSSGSSSTNSSCSSRSSSRRKTTGGCWSFIRPKNKRQTGLMSSCLPERA